MRGFYCILPSLIRHYRDPYEPISIMSQGFWNITMTWNVVFFIVLWSRSKKKKLQTKDLHCFKHIASSIFSIQILLPKFSNKKIPKIQFFLMLIRDSSLKMDEFSRSRWNCWELMLNVAWRSEFKEKICPFILEAVMKRKKKNVLILNIFVYRCCMK